MEDKFPIVGWGGTQGLLSLQPKFGGSVKQQMNGQPGSIVLILNLI